MQICSIVLFPKRPNQKFLADPACIWFQHVYAEHVYMIPNPSHSTSSSSTCCSWLLTGVLCRSSLGFCSPRVRWEKPGGCCHPSRQPVPYAIFSQTQHTSHLSGTLGWLALPYLQPLDSWLDVQRAVGPWNVRNAGSKLRNTV